MTPIVDTPDGIRAYRYLATLHGLRMEITMQEKYGFPPTACPTRGRALGSAQRILQENGLQAPRSRKRCLELMEELCRQKMYTQNDGRGATT